MGITDEARDELLRTSTGALRLELRRLCVPNGPALALWRAPTDNDGLKLAELQDLKPLGRWRTAGLDALQRRVAVTDTRGTVDARRRDHRDRSRAARCRSGGS